MMKKKRWRIATLETGGRMELESGMVKQTWRNEEKEGGRGGRETF